jgi:hypothetical protein
MRRLLPVLLLLPVFATAAHAETVACPDLAQAALVGTCPSEEELQFTFNGYCSDNARIYNWQEEQVCTDYPLYRRLKNVVLWEAGKGDFQGYLSCDLTQQRIKAAKPARISVETKGKLTRVVCSYGEGITFAYRTKARCKVEGSGDCAADPAACKATCD